MSFCFGGNDGIEDMPNYAELVGLVGTDTVIVVQGIEDASKSVLRTSNEAADACVMSRGLAAN